MWIKMKLA